MTDGSDYKISKIDNLTCDNTTFVVCFCILVIKQGDNILFNNPSPSSTLFCRPLRIYFRKENSSFLKEVFKSLETEVLNLKQFSCTFDDKEYTFNGNFYPSMNDGKVVNAILGITYSRHCFICNSRGDSISKVSPSASSYSNSDIFKFGIQPLHILIRVTEWVLKISYSKCGSTSLKDQSYIARRLLIHQKIKEAFAINIDVPSIKNGRTTDGKMARIVFSQPVKFASILEIDESFISNISCLLACVSSVRKVNTNKYLEVAERVYQFHQKNYDSVNITPTVHKFLCHGHQLLQNSLFSPGVLSEQVIEFSHKFTKKFKQLSFSNSRQNILRDVFNRFVVQSHPLISSEFHRLKNVTSVFFPEEMFVDMLDDEQLV